MEAKEIVFFEGCYDFKIGDTIKCSYSRVKGRAGEIRTLKNSQEVMLINQIFQPYGDDWKLINKK